MTEHEPSFYEHIDDELLSGLPDLHRRLAHRASTRRGMQLTPADLDLLYIIGAGEFIAAKAAGYQRQRALNAAAQRAPRQSDDTHDPSSGAGAEELEQVRRLIARKPRSRPPTKRS